MDEIERQLHNYWSDVTAQYPEPDIGPMLGVLQLEPEPPTSDDYWSETITLDAPPENPARPPWYVGVAAVALLVVAFSGMYVISRTIGLNPGAEVETPNIVPENFYELPSLEGTSDPWRSRDDLVGPQPKPNIVNATPGDDGERPLPLGTITELPTGVYPDLLPASCQAEGCTYGEDRSGFGDANFIDPDDPTREVGAVAARGSIFIRQGFVNETEEPLGNGFDVALYVIGPHTTGAFGGETRGATTRYTSDYIVRGETDRCGPNYETQDGPVTCEWFVHEFPDGLPQGTYTMWAVWEAPCSAWIDLGYTDFCADPNEVVSYFASGDEATFESLSFTAAENERLSVSLEDRYEDEPEVDASGSAASGGTPLPDIAGATLDDSFTRRLPSGSVTELPTGDYLDFLFEICEQNLCFRDAHFVQPDNPEVGSGPYTSELPFYIREGFVNDTDEALGEGFEVVLYVFEMDEDRGLAGATTKYNADYILRGETERCGPGYNDQTGSVACEWFVFEFLEGLPEGRFALWAVWNAPCNAWIDLGFTESCEDPNEVMSFFSSGVDSPFEPLPPEYYQRRPVR